MRAVFEAKIPGTSGPDVALFNRFQKAWPSMNHGNYSPGISAANVRKILGKSEIEDLIQFSKTTLEQFHYRNDYKEFLELVLIFLEDAPSHQVTFVYPGAMHRARWMSKVIYSLKIYLFRKEFKLDSKIEKALMQICIFIVKVYTKVWFTAPLSTKAPGSDLQLLRDLNDYKRIDREIADAALKKFSNHLWYLSPEAVAFALFENTISDDEKKKICQKISEREEERICTTTEFLL